MKREFPGRINPGNTGTREEIVLDGNRRATHTQRVTLGAMIIAIFGVLLLLNRQTGGLLEETFIYILPMAYAARYWWKSSLPVLFCMGFFSFLFGTFTTIFYAVTQAFIGMVLGACLHDHRDPTKTLLLVMLLSALSSVVSTILLASLFGYDINMEVMEMQSMMAVAMEKAGVVLPENILTYDYLKRIFIISMVFAGLLQGFVVYVVSLLILRCLRFPIQKPKPILDYNPPKWSGYLALGLFFSYNAVFQNHLPDPHLQNIVETAGILGYIYLMCFGFLALMALIRVRIPKPRIAAVILSFLLLFTVPILMMILGFLYICTNLRNSIRQSFQLQE